MYELDVPTEDAVTSLAAAGVDDVEVYLQGEPELAADFLRELASRCLDSGVTVGSVHPYVHGFENQLYTPYRRQRSWATQRYMSYLDACNLLGAPCYVSHGPPRHFALDGNDDLSAAYIERVRYLANLAAERGIRFCLENVSYGLVRTVAEAKRHSELVGPAVSFVVDFKSAWKSGEPPQAFVAALGSAVAYSQVSFRDARGGRFGVGTETGDLSDADLVAALCALDACQEGAARHVLEIQPTSVRELCSSIRAVDTLLAAVRTREPA
jgi:sugar phosphate isomerase/epimerase